MSDLSNSVSISQLARREKMVTSIEGGFPFQLRPVAKRSDRSAPRIEGTQHVKKFYDRRPLMNSIRGAVQLKVLSYTQISDRSAPKIDSSVRIQYVERKAFLGSVLNGAHNFYERLISVMSSGVKTAGDVATLAQSKAGQLYEKSLSTASDVTLVAKETAHTAQAKAGGLLESGKEKAADIIVAGKDTAHAAQVRASDLLETGQEKVAAVRTSASRKVAAVRYSWSDLYHSGKEMLLSKQSLDSNRDVHHQLLADISANRKTLLSHVASADINDRSKPFIPAARVSVNRVLDNRSRVLSDIGSKNLTSTLSHVSVRDNSKPAIEQITLKQHDRQALLAEVKAESVELHPTTVVADRSAPILPQGPVDLGKSSVRKALLQDVKKGVSLESNPLVLDRSAPQLPAM